MFLFKPVILSFYTIPSITNELEFYLFSHLFYIFGDSLVFYIWYVLEGGIGEWTLFDIYDSISFFSVEGMAH